MLLILCIGFMLPSIFYKCTQQVQIDTKHLDFNEGNPCGCSVKLIVPWTSLTLVNTDIIMFGTEVWVPDDCNGLHFH